MAEYIFVSPSAYLEMYNMTPLQSTSVITLDYFILDRWQNNKTNFIALHWFQKPMSVYLRTELTNLIPTK